MKFTPGFFGSLFTSSGAWEIDLDEPGLQYSRSRAEKIHTLISYETITSVTKNDGLIWASLQIDVSNKTITLDGITNAQGGLFTAEIRQRTGAALITRITSHRRLINKVVASFADLLKRPQYIAHYDLETWRSSFDPSVLGSLAEVMALINNPLIPIESMASDIKRQIELLKDIFSGGNSAGIRNRNSIFVEKEIATYSTFFDSVEKTPLTHEQRVASVVMEDRNLLVAAAGSGKTSTVVGKVGYALATGIIQPAEILVLAFNNHAALELEERINERLSSLLKERQKIKVKTFHALGLEIIAEVDGKKPSVSNQAVGGEATDTAFIEQLIRERIAEDAGFAEQWALFRSVCFRVARNPHEFKTIEEWDRYVKETGDYREGRTGYLTMNGEIVKSQGELAIANWLFMKGISYEYERPYQYETANLQYRQYRPDFFFPTLDCYLEHYALDKQGNPPKAFGEKYRQSMLWKQELHERMHTAIIETTFAEFVSGELFQKLEQELVRRGASFAPLRAEDILARLNKLQPNDYGPFLRTFIKHAKSNELNKDILLQHAEKSSQPFRAQIFVRVISELMNAYEEKLRAAGEIDFEDMIIQAGRLTGNGRYQHQFRLILVDEFQDISQARARLVKALLDQAPECKLFAVGDDWQSIYRFAGSDIDIFTRFPEYFGHTETNYLTQTFRSNQGIADVAATFIQKNPSQLSKSVDARDKETDGVIVIRHYGRLEEVEAQVSECLSEIVSEAGIGNNRMVFILGRYGYQKPSALDQWQRQYRSSLTIAYKTIHSSKGLQADYVILIGLHSGRSAFPSEVADDPLLQLVMPNPETFQHSEERRLCYVALTRAKRRVFLLGGKSSPSCFLSEILSEQRIRPMLKPIGLPPVENKDSPSTTMSNLCPRCGTRKLVRRKGKNGDFIGCSGYPSCRYTRNVPVENKTNTSSQRV